MSRFRLVLPALLVAFAGCGGASGGSGDKGSAADAGDPQQRRQAIERVIHQFVDDDSCKVMSDRFAGAGYASAAAGVRACEQDRHADPGLRAGEYTIEDVRITDDVAEAHLALKPAGDRTYTLVKEDDAWRIDDFDESFRGRVGDAFPYIAAYEINGEPVNVNARIGVTAVRDRARPNGDKYLVDAIEKAGHRWVRVSVRVKSRSRDSFDFNSGQLELTDSRGRRYRVEFNEVFTPALDQVKLSEGDSATGFVAFQVPDRVRLKEVRFSDINEDPLIWAID